MPSRQPSPSRKSAPLKPHVQQAARRALAVAVEILGPRTCGVIGRWIGGVLHEFDEENRKRAEHQASRALNGRWTTADAAAIVHTCYEQKLVLLIDALHAKRRLAGEAWKRHVRPTDLARVEALARGPRGVIFATPHHGNAMVAAYALGRAAGSMAVIVDPALDPTADRWFDIFNPRGVLRVLPPRDPIAAAEAALDAGGALFIMGDHFRQKRGVPVPFLGAERLFYSTIALLSLRCNALIAVVTCRRVSHEYQFELALDAVIDPSDFGDDDITAITKEYAAAMERAILEHPEEYLWTRRWNDDADTIPQYSGEQRETNNETTN